MANKRINELTEQTEIKAGQFVPIDHSTDGTQKFDLGSALSSGGGLTEDIKQALLACFENVAWADDDGQDYYDALYEALYPGVESITAVYTQSGTVYETSSLDDLKADLVVTAHYSDSSTEVVTVYTLSGTLEVGTSTITVSYAGQSDTFSVNVSENAVESISAVYTQSGTVYDTDSLDSLKANLVVTATYEDSSTETVADYTLSGTLAVGTSTITVSYDEKTTTFTVAVTEKIIETVTVTWSGSGAEKTSSMIDATSKAGYFTIPFVEGDSALSSTAADGGVAVSCVPYLYSSASATTVSGYYDITTGDIYTSSSWTWASRPTLSFGQNALVAPQGYYVKIVLNNGKNAFTSNSTCKTYLENHATTVTLP